MQKHVIVQSYASEVDEKSVILSEGKCEHQYKWNEAMALKNDNLNLYNEKMTQLIEKYAIETTNVQYICQVCGKILPIEQFIQDGNFDNNTQKFITAYMPADIPLEDMREYAKYPLTIRTFNAFINRVSLILGTNMLVGTTSDIMLERKALVKNIIDIIVKHNSVNIHKNNEERLEYMSKKYHVEKDFDSVYFFELDDSILNFTPDASDTTNEINRLKYNNILLYFILIFITELNGAQITMMNSDKIANIYVFNKYGPKLFGNLQLKKNINGTETIPIIKYPVLCYLLFIISYFFVKYKHWRYSATNTKAFNPVYSKIIINSFVDLFNSIMTDAGKMPNDYVYLLISSKIYTQLSDTLSNNEIINVLKRNHAKYSDKQVDTIPVIPNEDRFDKIIYYIKDSVATILPTRKIPTYKVDSGIQYDNKDNIIYPATNEITDITNCPTGSYHKWRAVGKNIICKICGENGDSDLGKRNRLEDAYYYDLNTIANHRCLTGEKHDFVEKNNKLVCIICHKQSGEKYTRTELDQLSENLHKIDNDNIQKNLNSASINQSMDAADEDLKENLYKLLLDNYKQITKDKLYGQMDMITDKLVDTMIPFIGLDSNLNIDKYPIYLSDNVYIIDHSYNGTPFNEPIMLSKKDNRVIFREDHSFFKTDVYYYTDNRNQIDVFYDAVTLKLIGYKEKQREYIKLNVNAYLQINYSIKDRLHIIGYATKYIDIGDIFIKNNKNIKDSSENFHQILDNLIRAHILKTKLIIDKIESIIYKIKFYHQSDEKNDNSVILPSTRMLDKMVEKYSKIINLNLDNAFLEWNELRNMFVYQPTNWSETNVKIPNLDPHTNIMYVNTDIINYYDLSSNLMIYYLISQLVLILESNNEKLAKTSICQLYIEIINYIYDLYNMERYKNSMELKRFDYIMNGSEMMVDMLKKGQGLTESKELENQLDDNRPDLLEQNESTNEEIDEQEDLKEEADALENDYYAEEEDQDFARED